MYKLTLAMLVIVAERESFKADITPSNELLKLITYNTDISRHLWGIEQNQKQLRLENDDNKENIIDLESNIYMHKHEIQIINTEVIKIIELLKTKSSIGGAEMRVAKTILWLACDADPKAFKYLMN